MISSYWLTMRMIPAQAVQARRQAMATTTVQSDVLVIGGGLAGIVTALECLRAGKRVTW
jgi:NADPH-dependent 2,4-dienoyl-CoA reductase/sulfur reductase-like enzyme